MRVLDAQPQIFAEDVGRTDIFFADGCLLRWCFQGKTGKTLELLVSFRQISERTGRGDTSLVE
jgi:hypothetical protein